MTPAPLRALVAAELDPARCPAPVLAAGRVLVASLLATHGASVRAVLLYGACRREGDGAGLLDLYVLTGGHRAFHRRAILALLNAVLPPHVLRLTAEGPGGPVRAKVAVMGLRQFGRRMRTGGLDTTVWARFCQPATLLYAQSPSDRDAVEAALCQALVTAAAWAVRLGPGQGTPRDYWRALLAATYGAELRAERPGRVETLLAAAPDWYDAALVAALARLDVPVAGADGSLRPERGPLGRRCWWPRRQAGKLLNVLRLVRAAFTFEGGPDYLMAKIERHSGVSLGLTGWQRRHPLLAAPVLLWRLRRRGAVR